MKKDSRNHTRSALIRARELRLSMSISEKRLWQAIRGKKLGFAFKRQVPVGAYVLDFYCPEAGICVEVDGEQHESSRAYDAKRDAALASKGIQTLRVPSLDLFEFDGLKFSRWIDLIRETCESRARVVGIESPLFSTPSPSSFPEKRGGERE